MCSFYIQGDCFVGTYGIKFKASTNLHKAHSGLGVGANSPKESVKL
jgi:hypothetical protein